MLLDIETVQILWVNISLRHDLHSMPYIPWVSFRSPEIWSPCWERMIFIMMPSFSKLDLFVVQVTRCCWHLIFYWYTYHLKLDHPNVIVHFGNFFYCWFEVVFSNYSELDKKDDNRRFRLSPIWLSEQEISIRYHADNLVGRKL
jgi:hypothetical protein